jgi:predicted nucleic acid-binding protein
LAPAACATRTSGRKKSDFDLMIACTAIEHEATQRASNQSAFVNT